MGGFGQGWFRPGDANDPTVNSALRQRIALAMMSGKKGYPKTIGEGLGAIGDAIGDIGTERRLLAADKAQQEAVFGPSPPVAPLARSSYAPSDGGQETTDTQTVASPTSLTSGSGDIPVYKESDYNPLDQASDLRDQRAPYMKQLEQDPEAATKMAGLMSAEEGVGGANSGARQAVAETMFNRAAARGMGNINQVMDPRYYQPMHERGGAAYNEHVAKLQADPAYRAQVMDEIRQVGGGGSNISNLATDNASGAVAANSMTNQTPTYTAPNGENFFRKDIRPDVHGANNVAATANWANQLAPAPPSGFAPQQRPPVMAFDGTAQPGGMPPMPFQGGPPPSIAAAPAPAGQQIAQAPPTGQPAAIPGYVPPAERAPIAPRMIQPSAEEEALSAKVRRLAINNPYAMQGDDAQRLKLLQENRAYEQARQNDIFKEKQTAFRAKETERTKLLGDQQSRIDAAAEAERKAAAYKQFGSSDPKEVFASNVKTKADALQAKESLLATNDARRAIDAGAITGYKAEGRLDIAKFMQFMNIKDQGSKIKNTEEFKARMVQLAGSLRRQALSGSSSETDREYIKDASGGNINMEPDSLRALVDAMGRVSRNTIDAHNKGVDSFYANDPANRGFLRVEPPDIPKGAPVAAQEFKTMEEAQKAMPKMEPGTVVIVNGKKFKAQ